MNNYTWNKAISLPSNTFSSLQNVHLRKPHENNRTFGEVVSVSIDYLSLCIGIKYLYLFISPCHFYIFCKQQIWVRCCCSVFSLKFKEYIWNLKVWIG